MELVRNRVSVGPELVELLRNYTPTSKHRKIRILRFSPQLAGRL